MVRLGKILMYVFIVAVLPATALAASGSSTVPGTWRLLPPAPSAVLPGTSVWTGKQLIVFGNVPFKSAEVAAAYDPASRKWSRLPLPAEALKEPGYKSAWTGKEMLVWGAFHSAAFNPVTKQWRILHGSLPEGIVVWTGREAIGWGGGCCGDARSNGAAYNPATDSFRNLPRSPLAPSQSPIGAWTGHELILGGSSPDGKAYPARLARAAAYNPTTNTWRRIAPMPGRGGTSVWDGHELLVVAAGASGRSAFAYNPATNRWRTLASLPSGRLGAPAVWTGKRVLLWGGLNGLAYAPRSDRWSTIAQAPMRARSSSSIAWTGRTLIVWGGEIGTPAGTSIPPKFPRDGAAFTPATP